MNTAKTPNDFSPTVPRFVLGLLAVVFAFLLCSPLSTQAHGNATFLLDLPAASALLGERLGLSDAVSLSERSAVPDDAPELVETVNWKRLDAALARPGADCPSGISESHSAGSQLSARTSKQVLDEQAHPTHAALSLPSPLPPRLSVTPVALSVGTPLCFLPAARGLVSYPTPPPYGC